MWGRVITPLWCLKAPSPATKKWIFECFAKFGFRNHLQTFWPQWLVKSELSLGLLEKVLLTRIKQFSAHNSIKFPDLLQFAYQEKLSALHASFTLQEVINYNIERSSKVYTCLLDSSKAFDVVWIDGLFYKLYKFGICGNMWRLLYAAYTDMISSVMFNGIYSRWFCVKQSVRQGGVLSPWLYLLYLNDMLVELRSVPEALRIGNLKLNYVAQADDVAILSLTPKGLSASFRHCLCLQL